MNKGSQNIAIIGSGYVGMSLAILLSQNNTVNLYDLDEGRLRKIDQRVSPIKDDLIDEYLSTKIRAIYEKLFQRSGKQCRYYCCSNAHRL